MIFCRTYKLEYIERRHLSQQRTLAKMVLCAQRQGQAGTSRCHACHEPSGDSWLCISCTVKGTTRGISDTEQSYQREPQPVYNSHITYDERGDNPVSIVIE